MTTTANTKATTIATLRAAIAAFKQAEALFNKGRLEAAKGARKACQKHVDAVLDLDDGSHFDTEDQTIIEGLWEEFYDLQSMVQHQATGHYYYAE
jgi:hypothetical protein